MSEPQVTELEKVIDTAKTLSAEDLSEEELELLVAAASSWAALVWRKGTERPARNGMYDAVWGDGFQAHQEFDVALGWLGDTPSWWRDLSSLPPVPEATDEG